jgi:hypothetical protein
MSGTPIYFENNIAGEATAANTTIALADASVTANTLTNLWLPTVNEGNPGMIHGIFVTPASASAGEIDVLQFVPSVGTTSDFIVVGTYKFNQATTFYIPLKAYILESGTFKVKTTTGSPTCAISPHVGFLR